MNSRLNGGYILSATKCFAPKFWEADALFVRLGYRRFQPRVEDVRAAEGLQRCGAVAESMPLIPPLFVGNAANEVCKKVDKGRGYWAGHVQRRHI
jgi:hypothetical protein